MTRRRPRLLSGDDHNRDEDVDSSDTMSVSYRDTPVRVVKKQSATRKARKPVEDGSSCAGTEPAVSAGQRDTERYAASRHYKAAAKKAARSLFLILLLILSVWFLRPYLASHTPGRTALPQIQHQNDAVSPATLQPSRAPVSDPDELTPELKEALERWLGDHIKEHDMIRLCDQRCSDCGRPPADRMADFALESLGASVIHSRSSQTYRTGSACVSLFGFPLWCHLKSPSIVIKGYLVPLPGRCWPFQGAQGTLFISLSNPVIISHVTLDHVPRCTSPTGSIDSAPKDFEIYGMVSKEEEGALLGKFIYNKDGKPTQTFELPDPSEVHRLVELRVLSNWGQAEYTCIYRFRVHGTMAST